MVLEGFRNIKERYFQIFFLNIISILLTLVKDLLLIYYIIDASKLDEFLLILSLSIFISSTIEGGINLILIPLIQKYEFKYGQKGRFEMTNKGINTSIIVSLVVIFTYIILLSPLTNFTKNKLFINNKEFKILFLILSINLLFNLSRSSLVAYMQSDNRFFYGAKSKALNIVIQIILILIINNNLNIYYLLIINIISSIVQFNYMLKPIKKEGYKFYFNFDFDKIIIKKSLLILGLIIITTLINTYINRIDNLYLNNFNTYKINSDLKSKVTLINELLIMGVITISYPILSLVYIKKNNQELKENIEVFFKIILVLSLISLFLIFLYNLTLIKKDFYKLLVTTNEILSLSTMILVIYLRSINNLLFIFFNRIFLAINDFKIIIFSNILIFLLSFISFKILMNFDNLILSIIIYLLPFMSINIYYLIYINRKKVY